MKICIAQTHSISGHVQANIQNHLALVQTAVQAKADLICFPELSLSNYEPQLAHQLATHTKDSRFKAFQAFSDLIGICIGIGMPIKAENGVQIGLVLFQKEKSPTLFSKQLLHEDELPFFVAGKSPVLVEINQTKVAFGICYESLQQSHFITALQKGAQVYIASVAKPQTALKKAYTYFSNQSASSETPILMCNAICSTDTFISAGQSAIWNSKGDLKGQLEKNQQGLLYYNSQSETVEKSAYLIELGRKEDLEAIFNIYQKAKLALEKNGIFQWTNLYPNSSIIKTDLENAHLFVLRFNQQIIGCMVLSEDQEEQYRHIEWKFNGSKVLVIHRLVIHPEMQKQGFAKKLLDFAETYAQINGFTSIRLDVFSENKSTLALYQRRDYKTRGQIYFPGRTSPFHGMEKQIKL